MTDVSATQRTATRHAARARAPTASAPAPAPRCCPAAPGAPAPPVMSASARRRRKPRSLAVDGHEDSSRGSGAKMSARTSSGSWSGEGGAPPDIIDLDKFMRSSVRPARPDKHVVACDELVVDAGGVDRKPGVVPVAAVAAPASLSRSVPRTPAPPPARSLASSSSICSGSRAPAPHAKRYSHDSGLSDGSYARRKHRPHRRTVAGDASSGRGPRTPAGSNNSLRAFRAVCERALLDQQAQIARVAQLCERLTERPAAQAPHTPPAPAPAPAPAAAPAAPAGAPRRRSERTLHSASLDTSDVSSSSRSTRDQRRKDKHRTEECKTYKIIMNKLDELNRLFAARARSPSTAAARGPRRPAPSSGSVSVSDKVVATEPEPRTALLVHHNTVSVRGGSTAGCAEGGAPGAPAGGSLRLANPCALDVVPRHDFVIDSVAQWESRGGSGSSGGDPRCGFDLEDPVHLYSQAKRLQALPATMRRARSVEGARRGGAAEGGAGGGGRATLCALCRGYWRALTNFLAAQLFCYPDTA